MKHLHQFKKYLSLFFLLCSFQAQAMEVLLTTTAAPLYIAETCVAGFSLLYAWLRSSKKNQRTQQHFTETNFAKPQALEAQKKLSNPENNNKCLCGCCTTADCGCTCGCGCDYRQQKKLQKLEDLLINSRPGRDTQGKTKQFEKTGNFNQALQDFNSLDLSNIKSIGENKMMGTLPDGKTIIVRLESTEGYPTLEVQFPNSRRKIKVRYIPKKV